MEWWQPLLCAGPQTWQRVWQLSSAGRQPSSRTPRPWDQLYAPAPHYGMLSSTVSTRVWCCCVPNRYACCQGVRQRPPAYMTARAICAA